MSGDRLAARHKLPVSPFICTRLRCETVVLFVQVEKAPAVLKKGLKKEEAEELKKKLEAGA